MALVTKMIRCAKCGSSEVVYDGKAVYHCTACGMDCDHAMPAADLATVNRLTSLGGEPEKLAELRKKYRNLDITNWTSENRLQVK